MENNIILLGPKSVGKSNISAFLKQKLFESGLGDYDILKLDLFAEYCKDAYEGQLFLGEKRKKLMLNDELKQLDPNLPNYEELKNIIINDFENAEEEKYELNDKYYFPDFKDLIKIYEEIAKVQDETHSFCAGTFLTFDQTIYLLILERCIKKSKKPLIIDAGANIGSIFDKSNSDLTFIQYKFTGAGIDIKTFQDKLLETIPYKVFIEPNEDYENLPSSSVHDTANRLYLKNPESYSKYANIKVKPKRIYTKVFESYNRNNSVERIMNNKFLDVEEISKVTDEIIKQMQNIKTFE